MAATTKDLMFPDVDRQPRAFPIPTRRRRISPQTGRALELLGHAIEYLTDETLHRGHGLSADPAQLDAVALLMSLNREIYMACPEMPSLSERCRSLLKLSSN